MHDGLIVTNLLKCSTATCKCLKLWSTIRDCPTTDNDVTIGQCVERDRNLACAASNQTQDSVRRWSQSLSPPIATHRIRQRPTTVPDCGSMPLVRMLLSYFASGLLATAQRVCASDLPALTSFSFLSAQCACHLLPCWQNGGWRMRGGTKNSRNKMFSCSRERPGTQYIFRKQDGQIAQYKCVGLDLDHSAHRVYLILKLLWQVNCQ